MIIVRLFAVAIFVVRKASCQKENKDYLGSRIAKAYNFPWMVSLHQSAPGQDMEFFGAGSIVSPRHVLCSMDSFVRTSAAPPHRPFFQLIHQVVVYVAGIWGKPYYLFAEDEERQKWTHHLVADELIMWSDVKKNSKVSEMRFSKGEQPALINTVKRSPFGFIMSIAVLKVSRSRADPLAGKEHGFLYTRIRLPVPVTTWASNEDFLKQLEKVFAKAEVVPDHLQCYLGGYRSGDYRLVEHKMVYVAFTDCQKAYCEYDRRACFKWPVKSVHVCFRTVTFTNPCWWDQGAALYCSSVYRSVIGILTSAPTCGYYGLPAVFTLIPYGLSLLQDVDPSLHGYAPIRDLSLYTPGPKSKLYKYPAYDE